MGLNIVYFRLKDDGPTCRNSISFWDQLTACGTSGFKMLKWHKIEGFVGIQCTHFSRKEDLNKKDKQDWYYRIRIKIFINFPQNLWKFWRRITYETLKFPKNLIKPENLP